MAYCKNCGAYIPDGHTKCLACGQEENAWNQSSTNSATATAGEKDNRVDSEMLRRQLEEQRKKQQENSRKWAEAERARREAQQESKTSASGRSNIYEEDFEFNHGRSSSSSRSTGNNKVLAALSYLSVLFALPMLFCRDDDFAIFHAKQGLRLFVVSAILEVLGGIVGFGWLVTLFRIYFIYKGMTNASAGKWEPLPYIGSLGAQK